MICGCTQRSGSASFRSHLPGTTPDAEERRPRPAGAGNGAGNLREAAPGPTVIFVAVGQRADFMQFSLPLPHDAGSGPDMDVRCAAAARLAFCQRAEALGHCSLQTSVGSFLQAISED